ncbi:MAG: ROK family protein, partial [Solirubrobacteraceae bacterium]
MASTMEGPQTGEGLRGGIDLGGTKIETIVIDSAQQVLGQGREATPTAGGPPAVAKAMAEAMESAADWAGVETSSLAGVGVGSPGDVDEAAGTVANARNLPDWTEPFPL